MKKQGHIMMDYDFDFLKETYINDPDEFERITRAMIKEVIESLPESKREIFYAKQWRLEQELEKIKNPLERMNRMVTMFWLQVAEFTGATKMFSMANSKPKTDKCPAKPCSVTNINEKDDKET